MAVQHTQTNEQLEALHAENEKLHKAIRRVAGERDRTWQDNLQLQLQSLNDRAKLTTESNALQARCLQAEAEVAELKGRTEIMKQMSEHQGDTTATSAALRPLSFPALSGIGSGSATRASPRGRNEWTRNAASVNPPSGRARHCSALCWTYCGTSRFYPITFPKGWIGKEPRAFTKPVFGSSQHNCRASPRAWQTHGY